MRTCVGETIFLPSFFPLSPLGDNEVTWSRVTSSVMPAKNGVTTSDYSYKLVNVSTSDAGIYVAEMKAPHELPINGPKITLIVMEKPCEYTINMCGDTLVAHVCGD